MDFEGLKVEYVFNIEIVVIYIVFEEKVLGFSWIIVDFKEFYEIVVLVVNVIIDCDWSIYFEKVRFGL